MESFSLCFTPLPNLKGSAPEWAQDELSPSHRYELRDKTAPSTAVHSTNREVPRPQRKSTGKAKQYPRPDGATKAQSDAGRLHGVVRQKSSKKGARQQAVGSSLQRVQASTSRVSEGQLKAQREARAGFETDIFEINPSELVKCFMSCEATVVQAAKYIHHGPSTLLILLFTFHPEITYRFTRAKLFCTLNEANPEDGVARIVAWAPQQTYGGCTQVSGTWAFGLEAPVQAGPFWQIKPSIGHSKSRLVNHYMVIKGSLREGHSKCVWTMEENKDAKSGLPLNFQTAFIVDKTKPLNLDVYVIAEIRKGLRRGNVEARSAKPHRIDPSMMKGTAPQFQVQDFRTLELNSWFSGAPSGGTQTWPFIIPTA